MSGIRDGEQQQQQQQQQQRVSEQQDEQNVVCNVGAQSDELENRLDSRSINSLATSNDEGDKNLEEPAKVDSARTKRAVSIVSFNEQCQFYEVNLENRAQGSRQRAPLVPLRYCIMLLALVSPFVVTYSRTIINFAILDMIHPDYLKESVRQASAGNSSSERTLAATYYFEADNSCPVSSEQRERLIAELNLGRERARDTIGEKYRWDTVKQGQLKAAYSIGHTMLQILGGRLAEIYGSHKIMSISSLLMGALCFAVPLSASIHFYLIFSDLLFLGILGSFMTPALITLFSNWLTPSEKAVMMSFYLVSSRLGYALSSFLCGVLIQAQLSWRYLFYSAGWTAVVFSALFAFVARSKPHKHPLIKQQELDYLVSKNFLVREAIVKAQKKAKASDWSIEMSKVDSNSGLHSQDNQQANGNVNKGEKRKASAPWGAILTNRAVWAFVITKFCVKIAGDTVQTELPTYLNRVMHFSAKSNGGINASNYVIFSVSCLAVGTLAKHVNKKRPFGWSKTTVRKLFQCTASFGVCAVLVLMSISVCLDTMTVVLLMIFFSLTTFGTGGEAQIPLDISERYAGTIHAIGSSLAISGAIEPILVGFFLREHAADAERWRLVWLFASAIAFLGGVVFLFLGDATVQSFNEIDGSGETEEKDEKGETEEKDEKGEKDEKNEKKSPADDATAFDNESFEPDQQVGEFRESKQI